MYFGAGVLYCPHSLDEENIPVYFNRCIFVSSLLATLKWMGDSKINLNRDSWYFLGKSPTRTVVSLTFRLEGANIRMNLMKSRGSEKTNIEIDEMKFELNLCDVFFQNDNGENWKITPQLCPLSSSVLCLCLSHFFVWEILTSVSERCICTNIF